MKFLARFFAAGLGFLRELAGESAYARHLAATGRKHSAGEWRRFSDERTERRSRQAKCC